MRTALALGGMLGLAALGLGSAGCLHFGDKDAAKDTTTPAAVRPANVWPVSAEQIQENNAHQMTRALWDELDREEQRK